MSGFHHNKFSNPPLFITPAPKTCLRLDLLCSMRRMDITEVNSPLLLQVVPGAWRHIAGWADLPSSGEAVVFHEETSLSFFYSVVLSRFCVPSPCLPFFLHPLKFCKSFSHPAQTRVNRLTAGYPRMVFGAGASSRKKNTRKLPAVI